MQIMVEEQEQFLTPKKVAEMTGMHINTVYRWIANGLPVQRPGGRGHYLIRKSDLDAYFQAQQVQQSESEKIL